MPSLKGLVPMNGPFVVAQANTGSPAGSAAATHQVIKLTKPQGGEAIVVQASYDGSVLIDFSTIANERITLVHVGEKLIILFDNQSTLTIDPFFDSTGAPLSNVEVEVAPGRDLPSTEFASTFPITTDQSVLPAAGATAGTPASGADFHSPAVDPLPLPTPLIFLPPTELPPITFTNIPGAIPQTTTTPTPPSLTGAITGAVDEGGLGSDAIGTIGNDPGAVTVAGGAAGSLNTLVDFGGAGPGTTPFQFTVHTGDSLTSLGLFTHTAGGTVIQVDTASVSGNTLTALAGGAGGIAVFTLTLNNDGSWSFHDLAPLEHAVVQGDNTLTIDLSSLVKAVTADGTSIAFSNDFHITVIDDVPTITTGAELPGISVDESFLTAATNGIDGTTPDVNQTHATASFASAFNLSPGADGLGSVTYALSVTNATSGLIDAQTGLADVLVLNGGVIEGHVGSATGALAFTISVDSSGVVTFTEDRSVKEPLGTNPDTSEGISLASGTVTLTATITDHDGDTASASLDLGTQLTFLDDGPTMSVSGSGPALSVDESFLTAATNGINGSTPNLANTHTTGDFSTAFTGVAGADGAASTTYALSVTNATSGLIDAQTGLADVLVLNGGVIEGHVGSATGALAFTISVDSSGVVTFTEDRSVKEPLGTNPDTSEGISLASGTVTLTATITDHDGDTASASLDLGTQLTFLDDGPTMSVSGSGPALSVDESFLTAATNGINGSTPNLANTHTTGDFSTAFTGVAGADGAASTTYALSVTNATSGLIDAQTGLADVLVLNGGVIEGHVGSATGALAFTISVDSSGVVTFTEDRSVKEPLGTNPDTSEGISLASGTVTLTATITDHDGDTASASLDLGTQLTFLDDGPTMSVSGSGPALSVDESFLTAATNGINGSTPNLANTHTTGDFSTAFTGVAGADGAASTTYALSVTNATSGLIDAQTGLADVLVLNGGVIEGHVGSATGALAFTISVDSSGVVTFTEDRSVKEPLGTNPDTSEGISLASGTVTLTATITDHDGDTASASLDLGTQLTFLDDGPTMSVSGSGPALSVDESFLTAATNGINGSTPNLANTHTTGDFSTAFTGVAGADGAASTTYALSVTNATSGLIDAQTGLADVLVLNGGVIEGHVGSATGALAFTISVDSSGVVTFTEDRSVKEPLGTNPDTSEGISLASGTVTLTATITDHDGDTASASLDLGTQLTFLDDGPTMSVSGSGPALSVDESFLTAATNGINGSTPNLANTHTTGDFSTAFTGVAGADGAASTTYALSVTNATSGLIDAQTGLADVLVLNGGVIEGHVGSATGALAFTISVDSSGVVTFTEDRSVKEPLGTNPDTSEGISLASGTVTLTATITDHDGDTASASLDLGTQLTFLDDGPTMSVSGSGPALSVDESFLTAATNGINGSTPNLANTHTTGDFSTAFTGVAGADGAASTTYALSVTNATSGLIDAQTGLADVLVLNGGVIEGHVGSATGALAFTISVDSSGVVTFTEDRSVKEPLGTNPDTSEGISLASGTVTLTATITDHDGDTASASLDLGTQLTFLDDGPTMSVSGSGPALSVDESFLTAATNGINGSTPNLANTHTTGDFSTAFTGVAGADGAASTTYALSVTNATSGLIDAQTGLADVLVLNGGVIEGHVGSATGALAFTISVDSSGVVTFTEDRSVKEPLGTNPDTSEGISLASGTVTLTATITDHDGDTASASLDLGTQLTFLDDGPTMSVSGSGPALSVDESFLTAATNGINGSTPNLANTHTTGDFSTAFTGVAGADGAASTTYALSVTNATSGLIDAQTGLADVLVLNGGVIEGHVGSATGALAFTISVDSSGVVTFTEDRSVKEPLGTNPDTSEGISLASGTVTLTATITDHDGDTASASLDLGTQLTFLDDGPSIGQIDNGIVADAANTSITGNITITSGADGFGAHAASLVGDTPPAGLMFDGQPVEYFVDPNNPATLIAYIGTDHTISADQVFTLTVDPSTDQYTFDLLQPFTQTTTLAVGSSSAFGSGPAQEQVLLSGTNDLAIISGTTNGTTQGSVNGSTVGWGIGNNNFDQTETLLFDFTAGGAHSPVHDPAFTPVPNEQTANYTFSDYKLHDLIDYTLVYTDGSTNHTVTGSFDPSLHTTIATELALSAPVGDTLVTIDFVDVTGNGKVDLQSVSSTSTQNVSQNLSFGVTTTDGDGDFAAGTINIQIDGATTLQGTSANDVIAGGPENDILIGGAGSDTLSGGAGNDLFVFQQPADGNTTHDTITDFNVSGTDEIVVDVASQSLTIGTATPISGTQFTTGSGAPTAATGIANSFYFDSTNHNLWYSPDGTVAHEVELAHLSTGVPTAASIHTY